MKTTTLVKALLACFMLGGSAAAFAGIHDAGHSSNLQVEGYVTPVACNINWPGPNGGIAKFGEIKPPDTWDGPQYIGGQAVPMEIKCASKTPLALSYVDTKASTVPAAVAAVINVGGKPMALGLGTAGPNQDQIGAYRVDFYHRTILVDTEPGDGVATTTNGSQWNTLADNFSIETTPNLYQGFHAKNDTTNVGPTPAKDITVTLHIYAWLNKKSDFPQASRVKLDGLTTIVLNYIA